MSSVRVQLAEAVKVELNAASLNLDFTAERIRVPSFDVKDLTDLHVTVAPRAYEEELASRCEAGKGSSASSRRTSPWWGQPP